MLPITIQPQYKIVSVTPRKFETGLHGTADAQVKGVSNDESAGGICFVGSGICRAIVNDQYVRMGDDGPHAPDDVSNRCRLIKRRNQY